MTTAVSVPRPSRSAPRSPLATRRSSSSPTASRIPPTSLHGFARCRSAMTTVSPTTVRRSMPVGRPNAYVSMPLIRTAMIDPDRVYRLATSSTPNGLLTFPTCDGEPVVLDPKGVRNTPRVAPSTTDSATRRLRIQRLIGTDETKGVRGDLARARRAKELGHTTWVHGESIDEAIATFEKARARFQATLVELVAEVVDNVGGARNGSCARPMVLTPTQAIDWVADLARARVESMPKMMRHENRGHRAMRAALLMMPICLRDATAD